MTVRAEPVEYQPSRQRVQNMTSPRRYLTRMVIFLVAATVASGALVLPLSQAFFANAVLNGLIVAVLLFGVLYVFRQVWMLFAQVAWLEAYRSGDRASATK